jgi:hypothetical protein
VVVLDCGGFFSGDRCCSSGRRALGGERNKEAEEMGSDAGLPCVVAYLGNRGKHRVDACFHAAEASCPRSATLPLTKLNHSSMVPSVVTDRAISNVINF